MASVPRYKKRSYSSVYKIYRRLRFIRYKKKLQNKNRKAAKRRENLERRQKIRELREYKVRETENRRLKEKAQRLEEIKYKKELKEEFRQRETLAAQDHEKLAREERSVAKLDRKKDRKRKRTEFFQLITEEFKALLLSYRSLNARSIRVKYRHFREDAPKRKRFYIIAFNSTVLFLLSYFTLFLLMQFLTALTGSLFNYPSTVYYYEIYFNVPPAAWFHDSVKTIYSAGPLANFVIGIVFLIIFTNLRELTAPFKLFFLWGFLHGVNMLFGALLVGTLFEKGVGHVISWMYIMDTGRVLFSTVSIFLLVVTGLISTRQFLFSGNSYYNEINRFNRTSFILAQVLFPYIAGNIILLIIRQPRFVFFDTFVALTLAISLIPVFATYRSFNELYFEEEEKKPRIVWKEVLVLAGFVLFFRIILEIGLRFGG